MGAIRHHHSTRGDHSLCSSRLEADVSFASARDGNFACPTVECRLRAIYLTELPPNGRIWNISSVWSWVWPI